MVFIFPEPQVNGVEASQVSGVQTSYESSFWTCIRFLKRGEIFGLGKCAVFELNKSGLFV